VKQFVKLIGLGCTNGRELRLAAVEVARASATAHRRGALWSIRQSWLARVFVDYIAGQSVVLPAMSSSPARASSFGFGLGPFPDLRSQLAVVRQAFSLGHTSARRSQVVHRKVRGGT
jgi:hypothetical protein